MFSSSFKENKLTQYSIVFVLFIIIYIVYTFPLILHFNDAFIGQDDAHVYIFNSTNFKLNITSGKSPFYTDLIYAPHGESLIFHANTLPMSIISYIVEDELLGSNLFLLFSFTLSGLGAYIFSKKLIKHNVYSFICGFLFAFCNYKMVRLGCHYNLVSTAAVPFLMTSFVKIFHDSNQFRDFKQVNWKNYLIASSLFLLSTLSDYLVTIGFLYFAFSYAIFYPLRYYYKKWQPKKWMTILAASSIIIIGDLVFQFLRSQKLDNKGVLAGSGDLVSFFVPYFSRFISIPNLRRFYASFTEYYYYSPEGCMFLGFSLILLSILTIAVSKKVKLPIEIKAMFFSLLFFISIVLPQVRIAGFRLFYSPTAFHHYIPLVNQNRIPSRMIFILILLIAIVTFFILLKSKYQHFFKKNFIAYIILGLLFMEHYPKEYPIQKEEDIPIYLYELGELPQGITLIYPLCARDGFRSSSKTNLDLINMSSSRVHKKRLVGGYISRMNDIQLKHFKQNIFYKELIEAQDSGDLNYDLKAAAINLQELDIKYLVLPSKYSESKAYNYIKHIISHVPHKTITTKDGVIYTLNPN